ncbi:hypothetical protein DFP94_104185 [Fontibacillus phaseoli]|uniref:YobI-like P-loop NTPase domain-containing protein n=1 Tax=Fontibacillus phaseoli TaxID=1416533 RepID=A0A369BEA5_9BACL|nr:hypothetical protein [Fontibacillus phaseoli]RCX19731.1 hypothetical protein DFP94_104185 [Fontibacillus phaseoli]
MKSNKYNFQKLTPIKNADLEIYEDALNFIFDEDDIKNVALTGPYSAGKSSVLETYKVKQPDKRFLNISLAHFDSENYELNKIEINGSQNNDAVLEGKILNQLIHQINPNNIPQTHFKVKKKLSKFRMLLTSLLSSVATVLVIYMFLFREWSQFILSTSDTWLKNFLKFSTSEVTVVIVGVICTFILVYILYLMIQMIRYNRFFFKKLKIQGNEIEIFEEANESYFDKYLNEVLYLFENANAEVIVFEDMDRFESNRIFQKLREINWLINKKSKQIIRFFYLLRDDTFSSKDRTKFFDFIIPIVPVVDGSNSYDQFISHFKNGGMLGKFDGQFLQGLSLYIDDMRILKNIYNEYVIYHDRIQSIELNCDKLLAIIAYKNLFPRDFSDLQLGAGFVHNIFLIKFNFITFELQKLECEIQEKKKRINEAESEMCNEIDELDALYFTYSSPLEVDGKGEQQFSSRIAFIKAMKDNLGKIYYRQRSGYYEFNFQEEYEKLSQNIEYVRRKSNIEYKSAELIDKTKDEIRSLIDAMSKIKSKKLHEIINKENINNIFSTSFTNEIGEIFLFNDVKSSPYFPLIKFLIRNGYIDETYSDYMTYFYEHSLSKIDKIFLRSVTDEVAKEFTYKLKDHGLVVSRLREVDFDRDEILNFDLLSYLLKSNDSNLTRIFNQLKNRRRLDFISQFWSAGQERQLFVNTLNKTWSNIFKEILNSDYFNENQKQEYAHDTLHFSPIETISKLNDENCMSKYISNNSDFLNVSDPNIDKFILSLQLLKVRFKQIDFFTAESSLFMAVYKADLYEINIFMISLILNKVYELPKSEDYIHKNYTLILSRHQESLVNYVNSNINNYMELIIETCNLTITDDSFAALEIINNSDINFDLRVIYIKYLQTEIEMLNSIKDEELWSVFIEHGTLKYSEHNILQYYYYSDKGLDDNLIRFININPSNLNINYDELSADFGEDMAGSFFDDFIQCDKLVDEKYESLVKVSNIYYDTFSFESIPESKLRILVRQGLIQMNETNLQFLRDNYTESQVEFFILSNIDEYTNEVINQGNVLLSEVNMLIEREINDSYKLKLLEFITEPISFRGKRYSEAVKSHILKCNFNIDDLSDLITNYDTNSSVLKTIIISICTEYIDHIVTNRYVVSFNLLNTLLQSDKVSLKNKHRLFISNLSNLNKGQTQIGLQLLEMSEILSLFEGKRPKLEITDENQKILTIFHNKGWISGFNVERNDPNYYRAIGRKNSNGY